MDNNRRNARYKKRFEVLLRCNGQQASGVIYNISTEGMEVRTRYRFQMNDEVSIRVITPENERYAYLSEVRWWRPVHGNKQSIGVFRFGLKFIAIDPEHERLMQQIKYDPGRRNAGQRIDVELPATLDGGMESRAVQTTNLSTQGAFLQLEELPPPYKNEIVTLTFELPDLESPIRAQAQVVHLMQSTWAQKLDLSPGIGLRFMDLDRETLLSLKTFIENNKATRPEKDEQ